MAHNRTTSLCVFVLLALVAAVAAAHAKDSEMPDEAAMARLFADANTTNCVVLRDSLAPAGLEIRCGAAANSTPAQDQLVQVAFDTNGNVTGWMTLAIDRDPSRNAAVTNKSEVFHAAGFGEGYAFARIIDLHFGNTAEMLLIVFPAAGRAWVSAHIAWMRAQVLAAAGTDDAYWTWVGSHLAQLDGIHAGYSAARATVAPGLRELSFEDIFYINFVFEMPDVTNAVTPLMTPAELNRWGQARDVFRVGGCSALIRATATDLFAAHTTWTVYAMMLRVAKRYNFPASVGGVATLSSSYPATIHSGDDWYSTSNQLVVIETTNNNANMTAAVAHTPNASVSEFIRVLVATASTADSAVHQRGQVWCTVFSRHNSGTYNNQWIITNMALFDRGHLAPGTLWILEQMPGVIVAGDQTVILARDGYWGSYNIPFYPVIYAVSGTLAQFDTYGDYFSYTAYARARIFRRNVTDPSNPVNTTARMMSMLRYNNYNDDPLSSVPCKAGSCTPPQNSQLATASRGDLSPMDPTECCRPSLAAFLSQSAFGAIDAKVTAASMARTTGFFISGPTRVDQPPFKWTTYDSIFALTPHAGQPDAFMFNWTVAA